MKYKNASAWIINSITWEIKAEKEFRTKHFVSLFYFSLTTFADSLMLMLILLLKLVLFSLCIFSTMSSLNNDQGRLVPKPITTCTKYNNTFTPFHWKNSVVINLQRTDTILPSWTAMNVYYKILRAVLTNVWSIYVFLVLFFKQILLSNQE